MNGATRTAFRVYGRFSWPPVVGKPQPGEADGAVELLYHLSEKGEVPYIRWLPKAAIDGKPAPDFVPVAENVAELNPGQLVAIFADKNAVVAVALAPTSSGKPDAPGLAFLGAAIFEQWTSCPPGPDPKPDPAAPTVAQLRWLLARAFMSEGKSHRCAVRVGRAGDEVTPKVGDQPQSFGSSVTLDLALATPWAQTRYHTSDYSHAFPFRARFEPARVLGGGRWNGAPLPVSHILAGTRGGRSDTALAASDLATAHNTITISDKEESRRGPLHPARWRLGYFGIARDDGGDGGLYFPRGKTEGSGAYWPTNAARAFDDVFGGILKIAPELKGIDRIRLYPESVVGAPVNGFEEEANSIWFDDQPSAELTVIRHRCYFEIGQSIESKPGSGKYHLSATPEGDRFILSLPGSGDAPARLVSASPDLLVEARVTYAIKDDGIWEAVEALAGPGERAMPVKVELLLGLRQDVGPVKAGASAPTSSQPQNISDLLAQNAIALQSARLEIAHLYPQEPASLLPAITIPSKKEVRFALCATIEGTLGADAPRPKDKDGEVRLRWPRKPNGREEDLPDPGAWLQRGARLSLWPDGHGLGVDSHLPGDRRRGLGVARLSASLALPGFGTAAAKFPVELSPDPRPFANVSEPSDPAEDRLTVGFRLLPGQPHGPGAPLVGRLRGLAITLSDRGLSDEGESSWRFSPRISQEFPEGHDDGRLWPAEASTRLRLEATRVLPVQVNDAGAEQVGPRQRQALLLPVNPGAAGGVGRAEFLFEATEWIGGGYDRALTAKLIDIGSETAPRGDYVVLSEAPFAFARVYPQPLEARGSEGGAVVALYGDREWTFVPTDDVQRISLPPQAVGESMNKPRHFEIIDDTSNGTGVPRPWAERAADKGEPERRFAVETRFTPSADLWVRPADRDRAFIPPEWELRSLWTRSDVLGLGAGLAAFRGEFLYGLSVGVDTARERGASRTARVAEIGALLGEPLALTGRALRSDDGDKALAGALARRPERLEFWMRDPEATKPLAPARFEKGVSFALRETALHAPALKDLAPSSETLRVEPHGLTGGALWPIESLNFLRQLLLTPQSPGGTIENLALSPTGGDADQRAEFLRGQLAIISETRGGFVQRHRVEILGRISVFWHRAKHVVIYERTTNYSAQFPSKGSDDGSRRPIIRKVSEFIELLQPERRYPDADRVDPRAAGFLRAVRFNQSAINVDAAWSEDLGTSGWRIPLWNRGAAEISPQVYCRPDIAFVTAAEGEEREPEVAQECLDPDNLFFYAEVNPSNVDSDTWGAVPGIDFSPLPRPVPEQQRGHDPKSGQSETREASAPRVPRGHRRFTWHLAPSSRRTAVNASRGEDPLFAGIETLTFSRASTSVADTPESISIVAALRATAAWKPSGVPSRAALERAAGLGDDEVIAYVRGLADQLAGAAASATAISGQLAAKDASQSDTALQQVRGLLASGDPCAKLKQDFARSMQQRKLLVLDTLRTWLIDPASGTGESDWELVEAASDRAALVNALTTAINNEILRVLKPHLEQVRADVGDLDRALAIARAHVSEFERDVRKRLGRCRDELDALQRSYDSSKPWSRQRLAAIEHQITAARDGLVADMGRAAEDAVTRLVTEMGAVQRWVGPKLQEALVNAASTLVGHISSGGVGIRNFTAMVRGKLRRIDVILAALDEKLTETGTKYPAQEEGIRAVRLAASALLKIMQTARDVTAQTDQLAEQEGADLKLVISALASSLESLRQDAKTGLAAIIKVIGDLAEEARSEIEEAVQTLGRETDILQTAIIRILERTADDPDDLARLWFAAARAAMDDASQALGAELDLVFKAVADGSADAAGALEAVRRAAGPDAVLRQIDTNVVRPAVERLVDRAGLPARDERLRFLFDGLQEIESQFDGLMSTAGDMLSDTDAFCKGAREALDTARDRAMELLKVPALGEWASRLQNLLAQGQSDVAAIRALVGEIGGSIDEARKQIDCAVVGAQAYADRVLDAAGNLTRGGLGAAPSHILGLWAAAASAPKLPNLDVARERLGYYYDQAKNLIETTPAGAWFGKLGDELKALGLTIPFKGIEDRLVPDGLQNFDVGKIFKNFGGLDLSGLFRGIKLPSSANEAVKLTHAFDKKQFRAWVQIDIDLPLPGRSTLFAIGPFALDFIDARLQATVRLEASKDSDKVAQTGTARLTTDADASVGGQSMVTLRKFVVRYDKDDGLKVDIDPKSITINPSLRFIQDTLASLVPAEVGGLKIVKDKGVPVGVEHDFSMPPISLMAGTSGVSNIAISNHFALVAYPDFKIANRFALSSPEMPFLFSIFIIGGTGYLIAETEYRPFSDELSVMVEAAAGGSAALGFSAGPVSGSVFASLSIAIAYRKAPRSAGGGLTVSVVLLIAGNVDVAGIASVYMGLLLRMSYRDDGAIDGQGDLHIRIRISRFFTFSVRQSVQRQLRGAARAEVPPAGAGDSGTAIIGARG